MFTEHFRPACTTYFSQTSVLMFSSEQNTYAIPTIFGASTQFVTLIDRVVLESKTAPRVVQEAFLDSSVLASLLRLLQTATLSVLWIAFTYAIASLQLAGLWGRNVIPMPHKVSVIEFGRRYYIVIEIIDDLDIRGVRLFEGSARHYCALECLSDDTRIQRALPFWHAV